MGTRFTVRTSSPILEEGQRYPIVTYSHQPKVGEYHVEVEADSASLVSFHEGASQNDDQITINDLTTVRVLGAYLVAF